MERNLTPVPAAGVAAAQPAPRPDVVVPDGGVDLLVSLLVGLTGGVVGGAAAIGGWIMTTRRASGSRPRPPDRRLHPVIGLVLQGPGCRQPTRPPPLAAAAGGPQAVPPEIDNQ
jgi:hypothetical protein